MGKHVETSPAVKSRIALAGQIALEQKQYAETLLMELGIGGKHPDRESLLMSAMLIIATNYNAIESRS